MKRWIRGPQLFLGLAFSWSIPMVYTATDTQFEMSFVVLLATSLLWPVIYDTFYAMPDKKDDLKIGIHSTAIWFGDATLHHLTNFQILLTIQLLSLGNQFSLSTAYYWGLVPVIATIAYQLYLGFQHKPELGFKAFKLSQWQGGFVFAAISAGIIL